VVYSIDPPFRVYTMKPLLTILAIIALCSSSLAAAELTIEAKEHPST
jgi:hypothetical protein